jgi:uncharacterized repeat protein (TIGR01451 family)
MGRALAGLAAGILFVGLAGCSGGGGGGGGGAAVGGGGGGDTPLAYIGNNNPATLTASNAGSVTANVVGSGDVAQAVSIAAIAPESGTIDVGRLLQRSVRAIFTKPRTGKLTSAIPFDENFDCDTGSLHVFGTLNDSGLGTLQAQYNDCRTGDVIANGSGSVRVDAFDLVSEIPTDFTATLVRLTLSGSVAGEVSGTLRTRLDLTASTITTTANLVARFGSGTMTKSENLTYVDVINATGFTESVSGRVFHSVHGFVDISTTVPLAFATLTQDFPNNGMLLLTGANGTAVRVTALSPTQLNLAVDADGNGIFEIAVLLAWSDLSGPVGANLGDDDHDGMPNGWEIANGFDPNNPADALQDADGDGATNLVEYQAATNPRNAGSQPPAVGLSIQASDGPDPAPTGSDVTYTLTVSNSSTLAATNVVVVDTLSPSVTLRSSIATQGSCSGTTLVTCTLGTVNGSSTVTITIVVRPTTQGVVINTATVSTSSFGLITSNNTATSVTAAGEPVAGLQGRIDGAAPGATIIVEPGFYAGGLDFQGKKVVLRSRDGPATTIIHGNNGSTSSSTPVINMGTGGSVIGFTISGGNASFGGGIGLLQSTGAVISGNIFLGNTGSSAAIDGNVSLATIERNIFRNNTCDNQFISGVVVFVNMSSPRIVNNLFIDNDCRGVNLTLPQGNTPEVFNNTFVGNRTAIRVDARVPQVTQTYRNNILAQNGIGFEMEFGSPTGTTPVWTNNLVSGNATDYLGLGTENLNGNNGNISVTDPGFVNPARGNYDLKAGSRAIDAGSTLGAPTTDFDGFPRLRTVDIGAFEGP